VSLFVEDTHSQMILLENCRHIRVCTNQRVSVYHNHLYAT